MKIDGYARVITDAEGNIIYVIDYHFDNDNLHSNIGSTELIDAICDIKSKDSEVLLPITYRYWESTYSNGQYSDPDEEFIVQGEFILCESFKQCIKNRIEKFKIADAESIKDIKDEGDKFCFDFRDSFGNQAENEIEFYEEIYKEKYIVQ